MYRDSDTRKCSSASFGFVDGDVVMTSFTDNCPTGTSCSLYATDSGLNNNVTTSTPALATVYGLCRKNTTFITTTDLDAIVTIEKECSNGQSCDVLWTNKTCSGTISSSTPTIGTFYGRCSDWKTYNSSATCPIAQ